MYQKAQAYMGLAFEATRGTPVTPTLSRQWIPLSDPKWKPNLKWLEDKANRGSPVDQYDAVAGTRVDDFTAKGLVYYDSFPYLLRSILGSTDTVTGSSSPYSHKIGLLNAASTGSQPPSATLWAFDGAIMRQMTASQHTKLGLTWTADGALEFSTEWMANIETDITSSVPAWAGANIHQVPGWDVTLSVGGVNSAVLMGGGIDLERVDSAPVFTDGNQGPYRNWAGPMKASGKVQFVLESGDSTLANGLQTDQQVLLFTFTDPASTFSQVVQMSACQLMDPEISAGKSFLEVDAAFTAMANTTDAVGGGYSPCVSTSTTNLATPY